MNKPVEEKNQEKVDFISAPCKCKLKLCSGKCFKNKLSEPSLNSALRHKRYIEDLNNKQRITYTSKMNMQSLSSAPNATKKLNFTPTRTVFKNLIPININDSLLLPEKKMSPKKYVRATDKIPQPELYDFLEPIAPHIYTVTEPQIKLQFSEHEFNIPSIYSRFIG